MKKPRLYGVLLGVAVVASLLSGCAYDYGDEDEVIPTPTNTDPRVGEVVVKKVDGITIYKWCDGPHMFMTTSSGAIISFPEGNAECVQS